MTTDPRPVRCACGRKPVLASPEYTDAMRVACMDISCWKGPIRKTKRGAIAAWNKLMGKE